MSDNAFPNLELGATTLPCLGNGIDSACEITIISSTTIFTLHIADMAENGIKVRDSLADLERYRLQLEQNVARLRASLRHWQTWEIEYEGMKEEILELGEVHSCFDLVYKSISPGW